jgi:hypothetical protein
MLHNVLVVYDVFASPNKGLRGKTMAAKMWQSFGMGMFPSYAGARSGMT